jgi:hypothetical protein
MIMLFIGVGFIESTEDIKMRVAAIERSQHVSIRKSKVTIVLI